MDVQSDKLGYYPKLTQKRVNKSGASAQESYRKTTEVVRPCERRMLNVDIEKKKRAAKPKMERCV